MAFEQQLGRPADCRNHVHCVDVCHCLTQVVGSCLNLVMQGYTPLHMAALLGHLDAVKALLKSTPDGAFVDAKDSEACPTSA